MDPQVFLHGNDVLVSVLVSLSDSQILSLFLNYFFLSSLSLFLLSFTFRDHALSWHGEEKSNWNRCYTPVTIISRLWPDSTDRRAVLCIGETDFPFFRPNFRTFEGIFLLVFALHFSLPTRENSFPHRFQFSRFIQSSCTIVVRFLRHLLYSRRRQKYRDRLLFHVFSSRVAGQQVFKLTVSFLEFTRDKRGQREPRKDIWDKEEGRTRRCWPPRLRRSILVRDRHRKKELDSLFLPLSPWCPITRI